jgi:hypothetical protein
MRFNTKKKDGEIIIKNGLHFYQYKLEEKQDG